jgi:hypothetical protein
LTNKAIKLLKTKDRPNEQSQTKPISEVKLLKTKENAYQQSHHLVEKKDIDNLQIRIHLA